MKIAICIPYSLLAQKWQTIFSVIYCGRGEDVFLKIDLFAGKRKKFKKVAEKVSYFLIFDCYYLVIFTKEGRSLP